MLLLVLCGVTVLFAVPALRPVVREIAAMNPALVVAAGPLSLVALIAGWVTTEVGRQPWVVYRVMPTADAVTGAGGIPIGYGTLLVVYIALAFAVAWILRRLARKPLPSADTPGGVHV